MIFTESALAGAYLIDMDRIEDDRGFFARSFCAAEFAAHGLAADMPQSSVSFNSQRATLRGLHFQADPHAEDKLVRCTSGAIFDVIVDLRRESSTHRRWLGIELTADNRRALYVPKGFAHGFLTLVDGSEVLYMMSVPFVPGFDRGIRWNDPALTIDWPLEPRHMSARDAAYPLLHSSTGS
ncbi:MAG TPA: dTDP-4-dehydrorhamnose 3,5-epimerase [Steroidobacteraceae bacterium]|jgi:dTDP-4-dehydrorhamnose 3,5-epimerase|nr:dTDP-4-dehydrorhamnose 3,5-epimerase [Steroidobacteraceae bacterium]